MKGIGFDLEDVVDKIREVEFEIDGDTAIGSITIILMEFFM